jgi:toxin ParE2
MRVKQLEVCDGRRDAYGHTLEPSAQDAGPLMRLEIDDEALAEVSEARDYYAAVRLELGREFVAEVDRAISRVVANPLTWSPYSRRTLRYLLSRFPYAVICRVKDDVLRILAVSHLHRSPGYWIKRLPRS